MHHNTKDLTGQSFGRWTVLSYAGKSYWICRCECGKERAVFTGNLKNGKSASCGCLRDEIVSNVQSTHRLTGSPEYKVWAGIKRRCQNENEDSYHNYGGRGIKMCQRWADSFEAFLADVGSRPSASHSIERIENSNGYEPGNCKWATKSEQAANTRHNRLIEFNGETLHAAEWSRRTGIKRSTILFRLDHGWSIERTLTTPAKVGRNQFD